MKILVSPAKSLDFKKPLPVSEFTTPIFIQEAAQINELLKKETPKGLQNLMSISEKLAELNWERNQKFAPETSNGESRAAVYAFNGDVYTGLHVYGLAEEKIGQMQNQLRILSGLYGLLKPLDRIQPYRLEMGTSFQVGAHKNLYEFWKNKVTVQLQSELEAGELVVNLASKEYFGVIDTKALETQVVSPKFKDFKNGKLKIISFFAKKARGMMSRHLIEQNASTLEDLRSFTEAGYRFSEEETTNPMQPVFVR